LLVVLYRLSVCLNGKLSLRVSVLYNYAMGNFDSVDSTVARLKARC